MERGGQHEVGKAKISRRQFMGQSAATGLGVAAAGLVSLERGRAAGPDKVRWISPRGTLQVMDDFNLWVPSKMGYFKTLGIEAELIRSEERRVGEVRRNRTRMFMYRSE